MMSMPYSSASSVKVMNCLVWPEASDASGVAMPSVELIDRLSGCIACLLPKFGLGLLVTEAARLARVGAAAIDFPQIADVEDQRDPAVAQNGRAADAIDRLVIRLQALHHDLLLAEQFVHHDADPPGALALHDDHDAAAGIVDRTVDREAAMQV